MLALEREGDVFVLRMQAGENRFSPIVLSELARLLDEVEKASAPKALVLTGAGRFFSNGLDLEHMTGCADPGAYLASVLALLGRVLCFPATTVAAVNGHAFGAGAELALVCDQQVMRADRGFFCMPEIDLQVPLHPGLVAVLQARLPARVAHEVVASGRRFGGADAAAAGIVDEAVAEGEVLPRAVARAGALADKAHPVMGELKRSLHGPVLEALALPLASVREA